MQTSCTGGRCCMWIAAARWKSKTAGASCSTMPKTQAGHAELSVTIETSWWWPYQKTLITVRGQVFSIHLVTEECRAVDEQVGAVRDGKREF
ncbi:MAG: hypothetical protein ACLR7U_09570 [Ruthenibacterium lactatiformans]